MINLKKAFLYTLIILNIVPLALAMKSGSEGSSRLKLSKSQILPVLAQNFYATEDDIVQILELMEVISSDPEDSNNLVIFPEILRSEKVRIDVLNKRMFVTKIGDRIIAFLKLYVINEETERKNILIDELRCCTYSNNTLASLNFENINYHNVRSSAPKFNPCQDEHCSCRNILYIPTNKQTYLYYGGAFTDRQYRGNGYGSELLKNAFTYILDDVVSHVTKHSSRELALAYGQAKANIDQRLMVRQFTQAIPAILGRLKIPSSSSFELAHFIFNAPIPRFNENGYPLQDDLDADDRQGFGNLVIYKLPDHQ